MSTEENGSLFSESSMNAKLEKLLRYEENIQEDVILGNWKFAPTRGLSEFRPSRDSGSPLFLCPRSLEGRDGVLLDIFSKGITIANISDIGFASCLYTKEGWLLLGEARRLLFQGESPTYLSGFGFILHNIFTGERFDLPHITRFKAAMPIFSTRDSSVDYAVHVRREYRSGQTTIHVARPGDEAWEVYTRRQRPAYECDDFNAVIIMGRKVYCFDFSEEIVVFDLVDRRWESVGGLERERGKFYVTEVEGKIVKLCPPNGGFSSYRFFRLEMVDGHDMASWVEMSGWELEKRSWFVDGIRSLCVKEEGGREGVYQITCHELLDREDDVYKLTRDRLVAESGQGFAINIQVYDLTEGTTRSVLPYPMLPFGETSWVDLG